MTMVTEKAEDTYSYCCKCSSGKIKTGRSAVIYREYVLFQENEACTRNILSVNKKVFKVFI